MPSTKIAQDQIERALGETRSRISAYRGAGSADTHAAKDRAAAIHASGCLARWGQSEQMYVQASEDIRSLAIESPKSAVYLAEPALVELLQEVKSGGLVKIAISVRKEMSENLLDQAEDLCAAHHSRAALVIVGAALEQQIRQLVHKFQAQEGKFENMVSALQRLEVLDKNEAKQLRWAYGLRNSAAHGEPLEIAEGTEKVILQSARTFLTKHAS